MSFGGTNADEYGEDNHAAREEGALSDSSLPCKEACPVFLDDCTTSYQVTRHPLIGTRSQSVLRQYLQRCKENNQLLEQALSHWRFQHGFQNLTMRACCDFLNVMGHRAHQVYADVLDILTSQFLVELNNVPPGAPDSAYALRHHVLKSLLDEGQNYLDVVTLRLVIVALAEQQFGSLRQEWHFASFGTDGANALLASAFTLPTVNRGSVAPDSNLEVRSAWERFTLGVLNQCEQSEDVLQYCRDTSPVEFRTLLWPRVSTWLVEEYTHLLAEGLPAVAIEYLTPEKRSGAKGKSSDLTKLSKTLETLVSLVASSSFAYSIFVSLLECLHLHAFQGGSLANTQEPPFHANGLAPPLDSFLEKAHQAVEGLEFFIPTLRVRVTYMLAQKHPALLSKWDPTAHEFLSLMKVITMKATPAIGPHRDEPATMMASSIPSMQQSLGAPVEANVLTGSYLGGARCTDKRAQMERFIIALRGFPIKSLRDLLTVAFLLQDPLYLYLLAELFLEPQVPEPQPTLDWSWSSCPNASELALGLIVLALSYPALHASMCSLERTIFSRAGAKRFRTLSTDPTRRRGEEDTGRHYAAHWINDSAPESPAEDLDEPEGGSATRHLQRQIRHSLLTSGDGTLGEVIALLELFPSRACATNAAHILKPAISKTSSLSPFMRALRKRLVVPRPATLQLIGSLNRVLHEGGSESVSTLVSIFVEQAGVYDSRINRQGISDATASPLFQPVITGLGLKPLDSTVGAGTISPASELKDLPHDVFRRRRRYSFDKRLSTWILGVVSNDTRILALFPLLAEAVDCALQRKIQEPRKKNSLFSVLGNVTIQSLGCSYANWFAKESAYSRSSYQDTFFVRRRTALYTCYLLPVAEAAALRVYFDKRSEDGDDPSQSGGASRMPGNPITVYRNDIGHGTVRRHLILILCVVSALWNDMVPKECVDLALLQSAHRFAHRLLKSPLTSIQKPFVTYVVQRLALTLECRSVCATEGPPTL